MAADIDGFQMVESLALKELVADQAFPFNIEIVVAGQVNLS